MSAYHKYLAILLLALLPVVLPGCKKYERQPPNNPNACCNAQQQCTRLIIGNNFPFVKDTCTGSLYNLLDGNLFEGDGVYPLIRYNAYYDGGTLYISN
ncbi:MAG: hypothetical protein P8100_16110 [bacterium]